jgi:hypothetical protein
VIVFTVGLMAAALSGVVAYHIVGLYGDGPFASGYRRIRDAETGTSLLVHETSSETGIVRRIIEGTTLTEVRLTSPGGKEEIRAHVSGTDITRVHRDRDGDGRIDAWEYYDADQRLAKVGFSLAGSGVLDAWAYRDEKGQITRIEVSTRRDGVVDRCEYYEHGRLVRVEEDANRDGRADRWSTYEDGILVGTAVDADGDGRPEPPAGRE